MLKKLSVKEWTSVRPIPARLLKSAIDSLRPQLAGSRVLELFAGTGRFGIRALEEGAREAIFVEKHRRTADALAAALKNYPSSRVIAEDAFHFLTASPSPFDIVFADPPFPAWSPNFEERLFQQVHPVLAEGAIFLVKHPSRMVPSPRTFTVWKSTTVGDSQLTFYRYGDHEK